VRRALLVLGALAGIALTALGAATAAGAVDALGDTRIGDTRITLPGSRSARLDEGKHVVYYEVEEDSVGDARDIAVPELQVLVRPEGSRRPLELDDYSAEFDVASGGRAARAVAAVEVPREGDYEITVAARSPAPGSTVVLGRPITGRIARLILGIAGAAGGLGLVALMAALAVARAVRQRREARTRPGR